MAGGFCENNWFDGGGCELRMEVGKFEAGLITAPFIEENGGFVGAGMDSDGLKVLAKASGGAEKKLAGFVAFIFGTFAANEFDENVSPSKSPSKSTAAAGCLCVGGAMEVLFTA